MSYSPLDLLQLATSQVTPLLQMVRTILYIIIIIYISFGSCQRIAGRSSAGIALTIFRKSIKNEFGPPPDRADIYRVNCTLPTSPRHPRAPSTTPIARTVYVLSNSQCSGFRISPEHWRGHASALCSSPVLRTPAPKPKPIFTARVYFHYVPISTPCTLVGNPFRFRPRILQRDYIIYILRI